MRGRIGPWILAYFLLIGIVGIGGPRITSGASPSVVRRLTVTNYLQVGDGIDHGDIYADAGDQRNISGHIIADSIEAVGNFHATTNDSGYTFGALNCPGNASHNGSPCLANSYGILEFQGHIPSVENDGGEYVCAIELYKAPPGDGPNGSDNNGGCLMGIGNGGTSYKGFEVMTNFDLHLAGDNIVFHNSSNNEQHIYTDVPGKILNIRGNSLAANTGPDVYFSTSVTKTAGSIVDFYNFNALKARVDYLGNFVSNGLKVPVVHGTGVVQQAIERGNVALAAGVGTVTFGTDFITSPPDCTCAINSDTPSACSIGSDLTVTGFTMHGSAVGTPTISYICIGNR